MSHLHDPKNPRHARLFELLRQTNVAQDTVARLDEFNIRKVNADELEVIKRVAERSMQRVA